ncbi:MULTISPECIES: helix-turn-helix domain-containing protein [Nostocales]|jgi:transcriptional regulator with XRE-family HTH domain|uniref:C.AflIIIP n=5 Tax=Aphanizomenonaceae TaxID=1892259 RepID=E3VX95_DOLFA|nr:MULTISPECIES: helix-turn-helix transcriptional regulator [Nostocales]MBO1043516.1 helix-turn-helix transcriptional regulator [Aphanizomenon flos-aquae UKL13-PB]MBO1052965.1 helix-turn-helix transcriptional regulator [Dolichospermum sp. DET73]MTJ16330.1 helix-turn-helix transcriptional regulator [Dolichospermum sp. UHCC 0299]OBQ24738.1 MAG: DNA-binding protein [Aphanizomenon flos-aquae LD13]OBQ29570.1 MAG: DNA-binding protein [Aphanizomenon flos-aquae MDT14a]HCQ20860.1 XRE family transcript
MDARMDAFGIRVRYFRKSLKLSQDELAEKSDLHRTYIGAVERGERNISLMNIFRLADALQVTAKDLFDNPIENGENTK